MDSDKLTKSQKRRLRKKRNRKTLSPTPEPDEEISVPTPDPTPAPVVIQKILEEGQQQGDNNEDEDSLFHKELDVTYDDDNDDVGGKTFTTQVVRHTVEESVVTSTAESIVTTQVQKTTTTISTVNKSGLPTLAPCPLSTSMSILSPAVASCSSSAMGEEGEDSSDGRHSAEPKIVKMGDQVITSYVDEETGKIAVYEVGVKLEVMDFEDDKKWYPARIVEVDLKENEILVHFDNWSSRYDEWIKMDSIRLRPSPNTNVVKTQFANGEKVEALWSIDGQRYPGVIQSVLPNDYYQVLFDDGIKLKKKYNQIFKIKKMQRERGPSNSPKSRPPPPSLVPAPGLETAGPSRRSSRGYPKHMMSPDDSVKEIPSALSLTQQSGLAIPPISPGEDSADETPDVSLSPLTSSKSRGIRKKHQPVVHHSIFTPVTTDLGKRKRTVHDYSMMLKTRQPKFLFDDAALALAVSASAAEASNVTPVVESKGGRRRSKKKGTADSDSDLIPIVEEGVCETGGREPGSESSLDDTVSTCSPLDTESPIEGQQVTKSKANRLRKKATALAGEQRVEEQVPSVGEDSDAEATIMPKPAIAGPSTSTAAASPIDPYEYVLPQDYASRNRKDDADVGALDPTTPLPKRRRTVHNYSDLLNPKFDEIFSPRAARPKRFSRRLNEMLCGDTSDLDRMEELRIRLESSTSSVSALQAETESSTDDDGVTVVEKKTEEIVDVETIESSEAESQDEQVDLPLDKSVAAGEPEGESRKRPSRRSLTQSQSLQRKIAARELERNLYPEVFGGKSIILGKKSLETKSKQERAEGFERIDPSGSVVKPDVPTLPVIQKRQSRLTTSSPHFGGMQRSIPENKNVEVPSSSATDLAARAGPSGLGLAGPAGQDKPRRVSKYKIPPQDVITTRRISRSATIVEKATPATPEIQEIVVLAKTTISPQPRQVETKPTTEIQPVVAATSAAAAAAAADSFVMPPPTSAPPRKRRPTASGSRRWRSSRKGSGARSKGKSSGKLSSATAAAAKPRKVNHVLNGLSAGRLAKLRSKLIDSGAMELIGGIPLVKEVSVDIINCACGLVDEHGLMVQCELCQCWQHGNCFGIDCVEQMPPFYICSLCQMPDLERSRRRPDWLHEFSKTGKLPSLSFAPADPVDEEILKESLELADRLNSVREIIHSTMIKLGIARAEPDHPNIYQWHSPRPTPEEDLKTRNFNKVYRPILKRLLRANIKDLPNYKIYLRAKVEKALKEREAKKLAEEEAAKQAELEKNKTPDEIVASIMSLLLDKLDSQKPDAEVGIDCDRVPVKVEADENVPKPVTENESKSVEMPILTQPEEIKVDKAPSPQPRPVDEIEKEQASSSTPLGEKEVVKTSSSTDVVESNNEIGTVVEPENANVTDNLNLIDVGVDLNLEDSDGRLEDDFDATFNLNPDRLLETIEMSCNVSDDPEANDLLLNIFEDFADPIVPPPAKEEPQPSCSKTSTVNPGPAPPVRITPELCRENLLKAISAEQDLVDRELDIINEKIEELEQKQLERLRKGLPELHPCVSEKLVENLRLIMMHAIELGLQEEAIKNGTYVPPDSDTTPQ